MSNALREIWLDVYKRQIVRLEDARPEVVRRARALPESFYPETRAGTVSAAPGATQKDLLLISKAEGRIITLRMTCYHVNRNKIF